MPEYIVNLWLDGYDTEEQMEEACDEFIYEQLNFTASSVRVKRSDYTGLLARYNALRDAVAWERETYMFWEFGRTYTLVANDEALESMFAARDEVGRLLEEK